jgi:hypothetical protein
MDELPPSRWITGATPFRLPGPFLGPIQPKCSGASSRTSVTGIPPSPDLSGQGDRYYSPSSQYPFVP